MKKRWPLQRGLIRPVVTIATNIKTIDNYPRWPDVPFPHNNNNLSCEQSGLNIDSSLVQFKAGQSETSVFVNNNHQLDVTSILLWPSDFSQL